MSGVWCRRGSEVIWIYRRINFLVYITLINAEYGCKWMWLKCLYWRLTLNILRHTPLKRDNNMQCTLKCNKITILFKIDFLTMDKSSHRTSRPRCHYYRGFMIILRQSTDGRTPLGEWSARSRDLYLTTHNSHKRQTCIPPPRWDSNPQPKYESDRSITP